MQICVCLNGRHHVFGSGRGTAEFRRGRLMVQDASLLEGGGVVAGLGFLSSEWVLVLGCFLQIGLSIGRVSCGMWNQAFRAAVRSQK